MNSIVYYNNTKLLQIVIIFKWENDSSAGKYDSRMVKYDSISLPKLTGENM